MVKPINIPPQEQELSENVEDNDLILLDSETTEQRLATGNLYEDNIEGAVGYSRMEPVIIPPELGVNFRGNQQEANHFRRHSSEEIYNHNRSQPFQLNHSQSDLFEWQQRRSPERRGSNHDQHDINYDYTENNRVPPEAREIGVDLYLAFLQEEIRRRNLHEPEVFGHRNNNSFIQRNHNVTITRNLRHIANEFSCTPLRQIVRDKADNVSLSDLDFQKFSDLLYGLFQEGGVTSERVVVLFYFCSDLAIRALCTNFMEKFYTIIEWSQMYIIRSLSTWVQENGGWAAVLEQSVNNIYKMAIIGFCCIDGEAALVGTRFVMDEGLRLIPIGQSRSTSDQLRSVCGKRYKCQDTKFSDFALKSNICTTANTVGNDTSARPFLFSSKACPKMEPGRVFMCDAYVKTETCREVRRQFELKYLGAPILGREIVRRLVNKLRATGSLNAAIRKRKRSVLTEEKIGGISQLSVSKTSVFTAAKLLKLKPYRLFMYLVNIFHDDDGLRNMNVLAQGLVSQLSV
ncbi:hypothetical protein C0J52_19002 [Blattella germanica]|nr:hypothetical protein C0J52_19002 [Blattella germanica]